MHKYYSMMDRVISIMIVILTVACLVIWGAVIYKKETEKPDELISYPMANKNIEWTYACKGGSGK